MAIVTCKCDLPFSLLPHWPFHSCLLGCCSDFQPSPCHFPRSNTFLLCMQRQRDRGRPVGSTWLTQSRKYTVSIFRVALFDRRWFFLPQSNYSVFGFSVFIKETWLASDYIYQMNLSLSKCWILNWNCFLRWVFHDFVWFWRQQALCQPLWISELSHGITLSVLHLAERWRQF